MNNDNDNDNVPLYCIKKYRHKLDLMNDNIPLNIVKRRLHVQHMIKIGNSQYELERKKMNRKFSMIDGELQQRSKKVVIKV